MANLVRARVPTLALLGPVAPWTRAFSVLERPPPNYPGHVPLTPLERAGLAVGSGIMAFFNPYRPGKHPVPLSPLHGHSSLCRRLGSPAC